MSSDFFQCGFAGAQVIRMLVSFGSVFNKRLLAVLFLSFSSGLPLLLTGSTLQAWYTLSGVSLLAIGALTLIGWPYVLKPLWAPLLDRFIPLKLGRRRSWIVVTQLLLVIGLVFMSLLNPRHDASVLAILALLVAFFSATQDIAINAYNTDILQYEERGLGAAYNAFGYRVAMVVAGAIALILAKVIGWQLTYITMAVLMSLNIIITYRSPQPVHDERVHLSCLKIAITEPFAQFFRQQGWRNAMLLLLFIVIYKLCDAFALALNTPFLLRGLGFSLITVGTVAKFVGIFASLSGSFLGGVLMPRLGLYRSLLIFGIVQTLSNLAYIWLAIVGKVVWVMATAIFVEFFCGGLSTVAFVAFLMSLCDRRYTATQYALLSALSAVGRVFIGPLAAVVVDHFGWIDLFVLSCLSGIPALLIIYKIRASVQTELQTV